MEYQTTYDISRITHSITYKLFSENYVILCNLSKELKTIHIQYINNYFIYPMEMTHAGDFKHVINQVLTTQYFKT